MYTDNLMSLIGKTVEVTAHGMLYRGRLVEVTETDLFLQGDMGWIQLQTETVSDIRAAE